MTRRVALIAALLTAGVAHADTAEERALAHLDRGVAAFGARDFARARVELAEAQRLAPDRANPYRWLALTDGQLGDCRNALINVEAFLSHVAAGDPRIAEVIAVRDNCNATGTLHVDSTPGGAAVRIDGGAALATTPTPQLALPVGRHRLTLEKPGYVSQSEALEIRALGVTHARYALEPADRPVYKRWWFWAAIGAVAITAGATYELTRGGDSTLPPVTCDATGCHP
jgi:hypothetical protein